jgi:DNA-directed RNA polymerase beta subunit
MIKACSRDPDQRYQNVAEIIRDLQHLTENSGRTKRADYSENRKVATMFLLYKDEHQPALSRMMEDFCNSVNLLGVDCRAPEFNGLNVDSQMDYFQNW